MWLRILSRSTLWLLQGIKPSTRQFIFPITQVFRLLLEMFPVSVYVFKLRKLFQFFRRVFYFAWFRDRLHTSENTKNSDKVGLDLGSWRLRLGYYLKSTVTTWWFIILGQVCLVLWLPLQNNQVFTIIFFFFFHPKWHLQALKYKVGGSNPLAICKHWERENSKAT